MRDLTTMGAAAGALLKSRGETVTIAESSAGGLISAALLATPGASAYFVGGIIGYTRDARREFLQHAPDAFSGAGPSTEQYALRMAHLARERLKTTWAIAETGATGPTGNRYGHPAGHACVAVVGPIERAVTIETRCARREENMWMFAAAALDLLEACLREGAATIRP